MEMLELVTVLEPGSCDDYLEAHQVAKSVADRLAREVLQTQSDEHRLAAIG